VPAGTIAIGIAGERRRRLADRPVPADDDGERRRPGPGQDQRLADRVRRRVDDDRRLAGPRLDRRDDGLDEPAAHGDVRDARRDRVDDDDRRVGLPVHGPEVCPTTTQID
jgi:hypothetical protein